MYAEIYSFFFTEWPQVKKKIHNFGAQIKFAFMISLITYIDIDCKYHYMCTL